MFSAGWREKNVELRSTTPEGGCATQTTPEGGCATQTTPEGGCATQTTPEGECATQTTPEGGCATQSDRYVEGFAAAASRPMNSWCSFDATPAWRVSSTCDKSPAIIASSFSQSPGKISLR